MRKSATTATRSFSAMAAATALCVACACSGEPKETEPAVPVQIVSVTKANLQQTITSDAVVFPVAQSAIVPKISAPVKKFYVNRGSHVRAGQLLAELENRDLAAAAQENRGAYDQAQATYATATAADIPQELQKAQLDAQAAKQTYDAAQKVYDSRKELFQQGALPRKELDQAGVDLTNARNQYEIAQKHLDSLNAVGYQQAQKSAKAQLESAQGKFQGAEAQLSYADIRSPISGVITDRPLYPGEMAAAGTPLLTVMDISQVVARAHIPQQSAALLKVGDKAEVTVPGMDNPFPGTVSVVSPALDAGSTTVEIWVTLKNPHDRMKPGTSVQLSMVAKSVPDALVVPTASLLTTADGAVSVMVAGNDGHAHQTAVKTGIRQGDQIQIVDGLHAGDKVVGTGAYGLPDNSKITTASAQAPAEKE
ncbi:MAG TPA: efflux RND transporter periplasmic adaptor subunit [Terriglobales bacterium]|nr:efflux RND transporter periplasmic adaptor subunit [Terriglobales bacterium]